MFLSSFRSTAIALIFSIIGFSAQAQELGVSFGFHSSNAEATTSGVSTGSKVGYRLGVPFSFELVEGMKFKTGIGYSARHFDLTVGANKGTAEFDYIDIPALVQYNFNDIVGVYGGLTMALNIGKDIEGIPGVTSADGAESIVPMATVGLSTTFNDMVGFDFYYEHGIGDIADGIKNYSVFGANFIYWIY